jgi:hypothetical protein
MPTAAPAHEEESTGIAVASDPIHGYARLLGVTISADFASAHTRAAFARLYRQPMRGIFLRRPRVTVPRRICLEALLAAR